MPAGWCRGYELAAQQEELEKFVASGEHIEADIYRPGLRARAERALFNLKENVRKYKEGSQRENKRRAMKTEDRRQWLAKNCRTYILLRSRKQAIGLIQSALDAAKLSAPSGKRLYVDIATIRNGLGTKY